MTSSLLIWIGLPVLLFWSVGAYNRLMRLRGEAKAGFGQIDAVLQQQLKLAQALVSEAQGGPPAWGSVRAASGQLAACLAVARTRPLDAPAIGAVAAAQGVLEMAWERAEREDAHDLTGPHLPTGLPIERQQLLQQAHAQAQRFNEAVNRYNAAIGQFPAMLLAWTFGFRPGRTL